MRRVIGLEAAPAALLMAIGFLAAPAQAEVWYGTDGNHQEMENGDIRRVQVEHEARTVETKVLLHEEVYGDVLRVYYDTRPRDPGPEFVLAVRIIPVTDVIDHWDLERVERFPRYFNYEGERVRCRGGQATLTQRRGVYTEVPRRCLSSAGKVPRRVRASVWSWTYGRDPSERETWHDWAPRPRRFGGWVRQG